MTVAKVDKADELAGDLADWIEAMSDSVAEEILGSVFRPQVVQPSRAEALAYWRTLMFNPDGSPNGIGREQVLARSGVDGFEKIAKALQAQDRGEQDGEAVPAPGRGY